MAFGQDKVDDGVNKSNAGHDLCVWQSGFIGSCNKFNFFVLNISHPSIKILAQKSEEMATPIGTHT